ncbi:hypothetical protein DVQ11_07180 [Yersinia enterocolitica]|nr:hypothetical protein [Yersinia enterocolitica]
MHLPPSCNSNYLGYMILFQTISSMLQLCATVLNHVCNRSVNLVLFLTISKDKQYSNMKWSSA